MTTIPIRERFAQRYRHKRAIGVPVRSYGKMSEQNDVDSGLAEYFAASVLGCEVNDSIVDGNDGGYDFIYQGMGVDVKWMARDMMGNPRKTGHIFVDSNKLTSDIYIAVSGSEDTTYECVGWCTRQDLIDSPRWTSKYADSAGSYTRFCVKTNDLRPMQELFNLRSK